jgi:hypothetical protein
MPAMSPPRAPEIRGSRTFTTDDAERDTARLFVDYSRKTGFWETTPLRLASAFPSRLRNTGASF